MALAVQRASEQFPNNVNKSPEAFADSARQLLMMRVASGTVTNTTLQALCLVGLFYFTINRTGLARLHIDIAKSLMSSSIVVSCAGSERTPALEQQRYIFWSLHVLDQLLGRDFAMPNIMHDLLTPTCWRTFLIKTPHAAKVPILPYDKSQDPGENGPGMWATLVQLTMIWGLTRKYVSECAEGRNETPWSPNSTYTQINSVLLDAETCLPDAYRFDVLRIDKASPEDIRDNRHVWLLWIYIQIIYHSIHAVLNHPFLYFQKASQTRPGRNIFWRTASELACLHSMWVSRIIEMAASRDLIISDPFVAQFAAISATLHLHQIKATDERQRTRALAGLQTCTKAVERLSHYWPASRHMLQMIEAIQKNASWTSMPESHASAKISLNTALMWQVLGYDDHSSQDSSQRAGLFHNSFPVNPKTRVRGDVTAVEGPNCAGISEEPHATRRITADSPTWFNSLAVPNTANSNDNSPVQDNDNVQSRTNTTPPPGPVIEDWIYDDAPGQETLMELDYMFMQECRDLASDQDIMQLGIF